MRIRHELREKGIHEDLITAAIDKLKPTEMDHAREIWQKKFGTPIQNHEEWVKQARFLQSRGFDFDTIKKILDEQTKHH